MAADSTVILQLNIRTLMIPVHSSPYAESVVEWE